MKDFCTHIALSHEKPEDATDAYDNLGRITELISGLFWLIYQTLDGHDSRVPAVAAFGVDLCQELDRRAELLYEFKTAEEATAAKRRKGA